MKITLRTHRSYLLLTVALSISLSASFLETLASDSGSAPATGYKPEDEAAVKQKLAPVAEVRGNGAGEKPGKASKAGNTNAISEKSATGETARTSDSDASSGTDSKGLDKNGTVRAEHNDGEASKDGETKPSKSDASANASNGASDSPEAALKGSNSSNNSPQSTDSKESNAASSDTDESDQRDAGTVVLKPGQKLRIAGFSERRRAVIVDEKAAEPPPTHHRLQMRLTGSMCIACLHEFQDKILQVYGVERVKIEKSETPSLQAYAPEVGNYADGIIYIDTAKLDPIDLRAYMRILGYHSYKFTDREVASVPPEGQKKI